MNTVLLETINRTCEANIRYGLPEREVISTGLPQLDAIMGGGIPLGRVVEIYGPESSGKTALALHLSQQLPGPALYIDADHGLSPYILNGRDVYLLNVDTLEDALDACSIAIMGGFGSIVIDTVASLPTNEEARNSINNTYWDKQERQAKIMSKALPILVPLLHDRGCTLILVNQTRVKPGIFRPCEYSTGGNAVGYYAALRLDVRRTEHYKTADIVMGQALTVRTEKCKYAVPGKRTTARLIYGEGVSA